MLPHLRIICSIWVVVFLSDNSWCFRVRRQIVNVPSFIVRLDSQKHIDFSLQSPYGGGRPGRVKRGKAKAGGGGGGDDDAGSDEE